jgi:hypothetical protein
MLEAHDQSARRTGQGAQRILPFAACALDEHPGPRRTAAKSNQEKIAKSSIMNWR